MIIENQKEPRYSSLRNILTKFPLTIFLWVVIIVMFSLLTDKFLTVSNMMNIIVQVSSGVGIVALASFMAICSTGVDLSLGGTVAVAGMVAGKILIWDLPILNTIRESNQILLIFIAITSALAAGLIIGAINGLILSKTKIPAFIITLAMLRVGETVARVIGSGTSIRVTNDIFKFIGGGSFFDVKVGERTIGLLPITLLIMVPLYIFFQILMKHTRFGTYVYAIGGNNEAAVLSGINVDKTRFIVFFINGLLAAIAGVVLASRLASSIASTGLGMEFDGIAAAVVGGAALTGGRSSPFRTLIGAFMIGALRNGLNLIGMQNSIQMITIGLVMGAIVAVDALRTKEI
jgi:ribose transport system permease protein